MPEKIFEAILSRLSDLVSAKMGLHFPPHKRADLVKGIRAAARELGYDRVEAFAEWLVSSELDEEQIEILARHIVVGETYFLRDLDAFRELEVRILPELLRSRRSSDRRLRIWSAACCTGEEPYSIAMLLDRAVPDIHDWNISILATDINPRFLRKAEQGVYSEWSFRGLPREFRETYFERVSQRRFRIAARIRRMVRFAQLNLVSDTFPSAASGVSAIDVVLCRNVLIYFLPEQIDRVVQRLARCITPGGWLLVSACESPFVSDGSLERVELTRGTFFRKTGFPWLQEPAAPSAVGLSDSPIEISSPPEERRPPLGSVDAARAFYEAGRYAEAASLLESRFEEESPDGRDVILLARSLANLGKMQDALSWCERAIEAGKLSADLHFLHATILLEADRPGEAAEAWKRVLYLDRDHVLAHFSLGNLRRQEGRTEEADRYLENARRLVQSRAPDEVLPESDGITAGRLGAIIEAIK